MLKQHKFVSNLGVVGVIGDFGEDRVLLADLYLSRILAFSSNCLVVLKPDKMLKRRGGMYGCPCVFFVSIFFLFVGLQLISLVDLMPVRKYCPFLHIASDI